ncbi:hypothetical protein GP2_023_00510 [Gordonia paraffinivorans NBRC 108238]|uniref:PucR C-terminal helix-turn-helix domain-containing protein n=1 Tax=Gordonia paraffinivorans NBRC 108238 TaxID=1223543 RepID=A0ABQ0ILT3_9ACTN|nr:helix-turn-helix domain-containing protein [Gordonia paraffinivorans]GAC84527.1 hypothetical protein GP2_023_00510 [Gordonia paraffinivorans NBRC 108238]
MPTVGEVADRLGLLPLTPGPAERTRRQEVTGVAECASAAPEVKAGNLVCMRETGWRAAGAPGAFVAAIRRRGVCAVVVDTDDRCLTAEFVSACVQQGVPIYMLPKGCRFDDIRALFDEAQPQAVEESDPDPVTVIADLLDSLRRRSSIFGAVVLDGAVLVAPSQEPDLGLLAKTVALPAAAMHAISGIAAALNITLPRSKAALALSNPERRPLEPARVRKLVHDLDAATYVLKAQRLMRRPLEAVLVRELLEARLPASAMEPWVESFGYVSGDRVHSVAVIVDEQAAITPSRVVEALHDLGAAAGLSTIAAAYGSSAYALVKTGTEKEPQAPSRGDFGRQMKVFEELFVARHPGLAVGGSSYLIRGSDDLMRGLINARQMAERRSRSRDAGSVGVVLPVPFAATLLAGDPERARALHRSLLGPVAAYDREKDTNYVSTLQTFFALDCSSGATANELGIHINTLRYRLSRIEKLTGRGLQTMADRTDYYLALCLGEAARGRVDRGGEVAP